MSIQETLADYFREKAGWREHMALKDKPWDPKNRIYAENASRMAQYVANLSDDDESIKAIRALEDSGELYDEFGGLRFGSLSHAAAIHIGATFRRISDDRLPFAFEAWANTAVLEIKQSVQNSEA